MYSMSSRKIIEDCLNEISLLSSSEIHISGADADAKQKKNTKVIFTKHHRLYAQIKQFVRERSH